MLVIALAVGLSACSANSDTSSSSSQQSGGIQKTFSDVSHIHDLKAFNGELFLGTHEGLFKFVSGNKMAMVGTSAFDVMSLAMGESSFFASGHPSADQEFPNPMGLIKSDDFGVTWESVSLLGEVDFHSLEVLGSHIYGVNSSNGELLLSKNSGTNWSNLGKIPHSDLAINPSNSAEILLITENGLIHSTNFGSSFKNVLTTKTPQKIEWTTSGLLGIYGKELILSSDRGITWKTIYTFSEETTDLSAHKKLVVVVTGSKVNISKDFGLSFK